LGQQWPHYVKKFLNREALRSQLGVALGLSFPAWAELQIDARDFRPTDAMIAPFRCHLVSPG